MAGAGPGGGGSSVGEGLIPQLSLAPSLDEAAPPLPAVPGVPPLDEFLDHYCQAARSFKVRCWCARPWVCHGMPWMRGSLVCPLWTGL